ncbi:hypothetical protein N7497_012163 [Penicillium chrysogenum]|nr:hypothetical protein N7497_012163 [Penicillium chrysogenum]
MIQYRTRVRPGEAKRVKDALALSNQDNPPDSTSRGENYWEFLRSVNRSCGAAMVGLCALGLGRSAIGSMKERSRLELAELVKQRQQDLTCEVLQDFLQNASTGQSHDEHDLAFADENRRTLTGDVYELTMDDARTITNSDQVGGKVWLTDSYDANTASFITIPISDELKTQFIIQRPRLM